MYNIHNRQQQTIDETKLLENNLSNKINEMHSLLDSETPQYNINNMGPQFDVYFSSSGNNTHYYIKPCTNLEYDLQSCYSYSNASSSNSSGAYVAPNINRYAKNNGNFKKYPLRSDKSFNVVPNLDDTIISKENIGLKALSIGPDFYYKSDCHMVIDKMKVTNNYLEILSKDRGLLEILVSKFNANYQPMLNNSKWDNFNEAYNIKMYYNRVMNLIESEYLSLSKMCSLLAYMSQTVLSDLVTDPKIRKVTLHNENDFREILNDYLNAMNKLKNLHNLKIIKADNFNQTIPEGEKEQMIAAFDYMAFTIRQWHIMLWSIKEGICMIKISSAEQYQHFRNLFIGS